MPGVADTIQMAIINRFSFAIEGHFETTAALRAEMTDRPVNHKACEVCFCCLLTTHLIRNQLWHAVCSEIFSIEYTAVNMIQWNIALMNLFLDLLLCNSKLSGV